MKKFTFFLLVLYTIFPLSVFAYSDYLLASGQNIGIELKSANPIVVGSYNIGSYNALNETDLVIGDKITKINNSLVNSAEEVQRIINNLNQDKITITYERDNQEFETMITLYLEDNEYKTGLYIKDTIRGVATLTYIDVENKTFGALGHGKHLWRSAKK